MKTWTLENESLQYWIDESELFRKEYKMVLCELSHDYGSIAVIINDEYNDASGTTSNWRYFQHININVADPQIRDVANYMYVEMIKRFQDKTQLDERMEHVSKIIIYDNRLDVNTYLCVHLMDFTDPNINEDFLMWSLTV